MNLSKYTFLAKKYETEDSLIVNYLSGSIDMLEKEEMAELKERIQKDDWSDYHLAGYMKERGYLFDSKEEEEETIQTKYLEFMDEYEKTAVQLIFSTSFTCNFACTYCFQESYHNSPKILTDEITDKFFQYINHKFAEEKVKPYITLFGGEPLLGGEVYKKNLIYFLKKTVEYKYPIAIVTNGYTLVDYIPVFKELGVKIKEIQVTIDGDREAHDSRRHTHGKNPTFDRIMSGIDLALRNDYRINMRSILDKENIDSLPSLAKYCQEKGFLDYPTEFFETTFGRNYELHTCQDKNKLFTRLEMWEKYFALSKEYPVLKEFHKPGFHGMKYLTETGGLPVPIFDSCPAGKKEWAFDINGFVYGCTASVGVEKFILDSFIEPDKYRNEAQLQEWMTRDVLTMESCKDCPVSLSCGGGCGVLAYNQNGKIHSTNCRPVKELVGIGSAYYHLGES